MSGGEDVAHPPPGAGSKSRSVRRVRPRDPERVPLRGVLGLRVGGVRALPSAPHMPAQPGRHPESVRVGEELADPIPSSEAIAAFLGETDLRGCVASTRRNRERILKAFARYQPHLLVAWGQASADNWYRDRAASGCAPHTLQKEARIVRSFLSWLEEIGAAPPWRIRIRTPRVTDNGTARYTHLDRAAMERVAQEIRQPYGPVVRALWLTGLRVGELITSKPEHVDGGALWVPPAKTTRGRMVPLEAGALEALRAYWAGRRTTQQAIRQAMVLVTTATPHDLRHSRAKEWVRAGHPLHEVSAWLGHSSVLMTQRYLDVRATVRG